jgi:Holliday junction resolvase
MRRAPRVDTNHTEIVEALRKEGATIHSLAGVANGCPDLLCGLGYRTYLVEVKNGSASPSKQRLTPDQERFVKDWKGHPVVILRDTQSARAWARRMVGVALDD